VRNDIRLLINVLRIDGDVEMGFNVV